MSEPSAKPPIQVVIDDAKERFRTETDAAVRLEIQKEISGLTTLQFQSAQAQQQAPPGNEFYFYLYSTWNELDV